MKLSTTIALLIIAVFIGALIFSNLNPEILMASGINVLMMEFKGYLESKTWRNDEEQRKFILEYCNESI